MIKIDDNNVPVERLIDQSTDYFSFIVHKIIFYNVKQ